MDPSLISSNPSLLTRNTSKPVSRKEKKLIVLHNFTSLKTCTCIIRELKDASTDIIVVSNELLCKEEMAKDFNKNFNRGCNIIEVASLHPISIMQRMVYALLEKNSFVARDADHNVFTLLSEYSRGAATIVHMLTSLMQKSEDNSRTGFELVKQQLKFHIAHRKVEKSCCTQGEVTSDVKMQDHGENVIIERESQTTHITSKKTLSNIQVQTNTSGGNETGTQVNVENKVDGPTDCIIRVTVTDKGQTVISDAKQVPPLAMAKVDGQNSSPEHPLYMYINDILTSSISLSAHHLLNSLVITGPIPLPLFYVEELNSVVMNAVISKENDALHEFISELPMKQLAKVGVIRNVSYPIVYHKELNPDNINSSVQQLIIPKLICDALKVQMDDTDRVLSILCIQRTLENLLTRETKPSLIHLHCILILCNQLESVISQDLQELYSELSITNLKLKLQISIGQKEFKS